MYNTITDNYDTDIERLFYQKLMTSISVEDYRDKIRNAWKADKIEYIGKLETIKYEFINYSLHDQTHSQAILQNIYEWLGKDRAAKLSVGDLWLLLEAAYSHDIGMATTYIDLEKLWKDEETIQELINEINLTGDKEVIEALTKLQKKSKNNNFYEVIKDDKLWPLKVRKAVTYIDATYFRKKHSALSKKHILKKMNYNIKENIPIYSNIEDRFYDIVANVNWLHTQNEKEILKLKIEADGFDTSEYEDDKIHPQMIAYLLRLGDVLDIKNNRFDLWIINYNGGLSKDSELHYQKHKSVRQFLITPQKIEIEIKSNDIDVCNCANDWLTSIKNELQIITRRWNKVAPKQLKGFLMENWDLKIYYGDVLFSSDDFSKKLTTNSEKLMDLLSGKNIYRTNLVLFREYLQNAIDATKVKFATYYLTNKEFLEYIKPKEFKDITPNDIYRFNHSKITFNKIDINDLTIRINIEPKDDSHCTVKIIDHGIGMDSNGLDAMFNIGKGWSGRTEKVNFNKFPSWLKPTGGFGIGILSGFLLCDHITIETKAKNSPQYIVEIYSPKKSGRIIKKINSKYYGTEGTIVSFDLSYYKFIKEMRRFVAQYSITNFLNKQFQDSYFIISDNSSLQSMVFESIKEIINFYVGTLVFPIGIYSYSLKVIYEHEKGNIFLSYLNNSQHLINIDDCISFWNEKYNCFLISKKRKDNNLQILYKGIYVNVDFDSLEDFYREKIKNSENPSNTDNTNLMESIKRYELIKFARNLFSIIDIHGDSVGNMLEITRDQLKDELLLIDLLYNIMYDFLYQIAIMDRKIVNIWSIYSKKEIEKLIIFYYKDIEQKIDTFTPLIRSIEKPCYLGHISENENINLYVVFEQIFNNFDEIFKLLSNKEYLKLKNAEAKKQLQIILKNADPICKKTISYIKSVLENLKDSNETLYIYFSNMLDILMDISNTKVNSRISNLKFKEAIGYLDCYINFYSSSYREEWEEIHNKFSFLEMIFQKKEFYIICENAEHIETKNNNNNQRKKNILAGKCLFVDKKEFSSIDDILRENKLYDYSYEKTFYIYNEMKYEVICMEYLNEVSYTYEHVLKNIKQAIKHKKYFLIENSKKFTKFNSILVRDIPDFISNLLEDNLYIINPFMLDLIEMKDNILEVLEKKEIRKNQLKKLLLERDYFKSTVRYISEVNSCEEIEVIKGYVQLLSEVFELLD